MLKIKNKYYQDPGGAVVSDLAAKIDTFLKLPAQAAVPVLTIADLRGALLPADRVKLTRQNFNSVCEALGLEIVDIFDSEL